jgi:DNA mismatch endonuclease (patch repair protein)
MADVFGKRKRSWIMSKIRGRDTKPDLLLAKLLRSQGHAVRRYPASLPGSPDAVLPKERIAVFMHGCFWHGHHDCARAALPSSNRPFWKSKIAGNRRRDLRQTRRLRLLGWSVAVFWTCKRLDRAAVNSRVRRILSRRRMLKASGRIGR